MHFDYGDNKMYFVKIIKSKILTDYIVQSVLSLNLNFTNKVELTFWL